MFLKLLFVCACKINCGCVEAEDNLWTFYFSFYHVGSGDQNQVMRLGNQRLYLPDPSKHISKKLRSSEG